MDRVLRRQPTEVALKYLHHLQRVLTDYFCENAISLITSGRDTALSLMSMLVGRQLGIPWVAPTRLRIPRELYAFSSSHETGDLIRFCSAGERDRAWARDFLGTFRASAVHPAIGKSARRFSDVLAVAPGSLAGVPSGTIRVGGRSRQSVCPTFHLAPCRHGYGSPQKHAELYDVPVSYSAPGARAASSTLCTRSPSPRSMSRGLTFRIRSP
jgi:hypothetical protein